MMTDFTINKLGMNTDEDKQNIDAIKSKLRSIDQAAFKQKVVQKGLGNFVADQYLQDNNKGKKAPDDQGQQ